MLIGIRLVLGLMPTLIFIGYIVASVAKEYYDYKYDTNKDNYDESEAYDMFCEDWLWL